MTTWTASEMGKKGGSSTLAKYGVEHFRKIPRKQRPDDQVKPNTLYQREYRRRKKEAGK